MIDTMTKKPIQVESAPPDRALVTLPVSQLATLRQLFDQGKVMYEVFNTYISMNGQPATALVKIYREPDPQRVQTLLDSVL